VRKRKGRGPESCRFTTGAIRVEADRHHVTLPRLGRIRTHESTRKLARRLEQGRARIMTATITRTGDRWFVSFSCKVERTIARPRQPLATIGVDVGIRHLAVLSDGRLSCARCFERVAGSGPETGNARGWGWALPFGGVVLDEAGSRRQVTGLG
jgi:transposase